MIDSYIYVIVALLPLAAGMVVFQANPYQALVVRGILGAIAAMIYAVLGAADVALTEALVGTMLAITLYAIAVRSSLVMRLGILQPDQSSRADRSQPQSDPSAFEALTQHFRQVLNQHHLRLELVPYADLPALQKALIEKEVHTICVARSHRDLNLLDPTSDSNFAVADQPYQTITRIQRLYDIFRSELKSPLTSMKHVIIPNTAPELFTTQQTSEEVHL